MARLKGVIPTVLLVEDTDDTRSVIRATLERQGYRVVEARDGAEAVASVRQGCPDLILMDLNMPEMDGLAAAEHVRRCRERCAVVPIIAITAYDTYGMKEAALKAGCDEYLTKPLDFDRLEKLVSGFVYG